VHGSELSRDRKDSFRSENLTSLKSKVVRHSSQWALKLLDCIRFPPQVVSPHQAARPPFFVAARCEAVLSCSGGAPMQQVEPSKAQLYWKANQRLILSLLAIWFVVSIGCGILFVKPLNQFTFFEVPFGFWMAQQGCIYVFVGLIFFYAWRMDRLDKNFHPDNED
jgi:putative solute:sodium symporter small subunit